MRKLDMMISSNFDEVLELLESSAKRRPYLEKGYSYNLPERNRYPLRLVAGLEQYPQTTEEVFVTPGDKSEAAEIIDFLLACFGDAPDLVEYFIHELNDLGAWESKDQKFDIAENSFVSSAKIIPLDRQSDN